jgi:hypothetical protein
MRAQFRQFYEGGSWLERLRQNSNINGQKTTEFDGFDRLSRKNEVIPDVGSWRMPGARMGSGK